MNLNSDIKSFFQLNEVYNDCLGAFQHDRGPHFPEFHDPIPHQVFSLRSLKDQTTNVVNRMDRYAALHPMSGSSRYMQHVAALVFHPGMHASVPVKALLEYLVSGQGQARYLPVLDGRERSGLPVRDVMKFQNALNAMDRLQPARGNGCVRWNQKKAWSRMMELDLALKEAKGEFLRGGCGTQGAGWAVLDASVNALANAIGYFVGYVVAVKVQESYGHHQKDLGYWQMFSSEVVNRLVQHTLRLVLRDWLWPACQSALGIRFASLENASKPWQWGQLGLTGSATVGCDMLGTFFFNLLPPTSGPSALVQGAGYTLIYALTDFVAFLGRGLTARSIPGAELTVTEKVGEGVRAAAKIRGIQVALDAFLLTLYKQHCSNPYGFVALFDTCELSPYIAWETWRLCHHTPSNRPVSIELQRRSAAGRIPPVQPLPQNTSIVSGRSRLTTGSEFLSRINLP